MKIAIFGGSFDPVHQGHERIVKAALETLDIDKLIILPTFLSPFKQNFCATPMLRLEWLQKVFCEYEKLEISTFEIEQNRPTPSIESVKFFQKLYQPSKIYFIIGADHLASLCKWHDYENLCKMVHFVVASRNKIEIPKHFLRLEVNEDISSSYIRNELILTKVNSKIKEEVKDYYKGLK